jgi:hypothetical protein
MRTINQYYRALNRGAVGPDPAAWIMTFTLTASDSITLPLNSSGTFNFVVNWGDGTSDTITAFNQAERIHSYAGQPAGDYVVTITGTCTAWSFASVTTSRAKLKTIDQWGDTGLNLLSFLSCTSLTTLPANLNFTGSSLASCFFGCSALTTLSPSLFSLCSSVTDFTQTFYQCNSVSLTIPSGLFDNCTSAIGFFGCFFRGRFSTIPTDLFKFNTAVTQFAGVFADNPNITSLPVDLFRYNTGVTSFGNANSLFGAFTRCFGLTSLPVDLFRYNTGVTNFENTLSQCTGLTSLPTDIFRYNTLVTNFIRVFASSTSISTLPVDLFRYNTSVTNFSQAFAFCFSLPSSAIAANLFQYNTAVTNFSQTFRNCNSFGADLPADLFRYNVSVTDFGLTFYQIASNTFLPPATIFQYNVNATSFFASFYNAGFSTIPTDIFRFNTAVTNFAGCFGNMPNLTTIPVDLFRYNTAVTLFGNANTLFGVFNNSPIASVPADIFRYNVNVTSFENVFYQCSNLASSVSDIVLNMDMTKVTTTKQMFQTCTQLTGNGQSLIDKPKAAGYSVGTASNTGSYRTFFNCTALTDFATIPAAYK